MLQLSRSVKWVDVHCDHASTQNTKQRHRVLQQVRHHQSDTVTFFQLEIVL
ncbi:Uncharacterised protein [Vibrio cholerae]|nr:Uncharacterised protein [Vibrio cholerae]CSB73873.1 Uncharacterised protein [Vibrio cholerae]CSC81205.1 Uncharacterised protein [Vibrio cholerae]CSI46309.1 Uncharacterised protein [Vibrio cholerae]CSI60745.1 Uncharacterised protein [Vibrio cholerae]